LVKFRFEFPKRNFADISRHHTHAYQSYQHITSFQRCKVISNTVMPPSDFSVLENVQASAQQITSIRRSS